MNGCDDGLHHGSCDDVARDRDQLWNPKPSARMGINSAPPPIPVRPTTMPATKPPRLTPKSMIPYQFNGKTEEWILGADRGRSKERISEPQLEPGMGSSLRSGLLGGSRETARGGSGVWKAG